ncbi:uncharacterized protein BO80DRAFT_158353 [Aspergillus ibericus CBS 121593]|uniref:Uncharacterized protein n=1 Tax=Aspergillus ibericus CBS 121593 TaxID=1448316 RepID=A0A395GWX2_9EURO|nr:hypothetical protein BO80DRAFT_158353 [Aspergillus ibericus CBS 121593]RAK98553.1 hypothetical protein BO80DRAFT_158353 [Aspergillus ibericus CBS 121593]
MQRRLPLSLLPSCKPVPTVRHESHAFPGQNGSLHIPPLCPTGDYLPQADPKRAGPKLQERHPSSFFLRGWHNQPRSADYWLGGFLHRLLLPEGESIRPPPCPSYRLPLGDPPESLTSGGRQGAVGLGWAAWTGEDRRTLSLWGTQLEERARHQPILSGP